ncbi:Crp/Fnr family transcriptional regulator [Mucilaginibacter sp. 21P]|uniref:Crp/Fnr family transcriptional regulator n=1 Tax=Mucilaginibacter sp. 21P TaxID=2778902 RepID=UPI001C561C2C|nr:Crp/Fnr family transcriptional regulator [Mucilaginibacter sp. 21P]QXV63643.1 Crp/Fnr family transcriptional regulator [Mucilaginibacter sp. 21P]
MIFQFQKQFPELNSYWERYLPHQKRLEIPARTKLLQEGAFSQQAIYIDRGCLRVFFNNKGEEKTVQFFFEGEGLSSLDSFVNHLPSPFTIESMEPSIVYLLPKRYVLELLEEMTLGPGFLMLFLKMMASRLNHYSGEFVSFIRDTPEERYQRLIKERPHIVQRIKQHYIASYLGISSVHLSRIKSKLAKGQAHF